jgi:hypothetical protein
LLAAISFAAPWMAWGAVAAVGLPVLAHLLSRTRYREVVFPAVRLVQRAVAATSRIETPRHRLLMLLRWLVLMLLVLAFMRPQWTPNAQAEGGDRGILLLLLVDQSASMQRTREGATLYDRAQREAQQLLDQLDPTKDMAAVITVDHNPKSLLPVPTAQFSLLAEQLKTTKPGYTTADWPAALATTQRLTRDASRAVRLVTLSDQQGDTPDLSTLFDGSSKPRIDHECIDGPTGNTAVRFIDVRPYPAIASRPITATVEVQHYGESPKQLTLNASSLDEQFKRTITLGPNETRRVAFDFQAYDRIGPLINVRAEPLDTLSADNEAGIHIPLQASSNVLIIHDPGKASEQLADRVALLVNPDKTGGATLPDVETITVQQALSTLSRLDPASLRTVVLLNQQTLPDTASEALEAYVQSGGGVVQFVMAFGGDLKETSRASAIDFDLKPLRLFEGPARAGLAGLMWPGVSNSAIDPRATPILIDEMERIIVAEMPRGRGRLIAINAAISPEPGGLLAQPAFVVLFNELCRYASPGQALPAPIHPGEAIPEQMLEQLLSSSRAVLPDGADISSGLFERPGLYAASSLESADTKAVYVSLDPSESDTRATSAWSEQTVGSAVTTGSSGQPVSSALRSKTIELWPALLVAAMAMIAFESLLLWRFARPTQASLQGSLA